MDVSKLETKKLLMDLKYWKEEFNIKKEIVNSLDIVFNKEIENYINDNDDLKKKWDEHSNKLNNHINDLVSEDDLETETKQDISEIVSKKPKNNSNKNPFFKQLYRDIVKKTHPDKIKNRSKHEYVEKVEIYKECTEAYNDNNIIDLLYHADSLNINFELDGSGVIDELENSLNDIKNRSTYLENTYTWKWYKLATENKKNMIMLYIHQELGI